MIDYIASLDSTHWVLLTFALGSTIIAIVQFMSQPEMRALWADVRDRLLNPVRARDEARLRDLVTGPLTTGEPLITEARLRELGRMDGWRTDLQRQPYPPKPWQPDSAPPPLKYLTPSEKRGVDSDLAALRIRDAERRARRRQS